MTTKTHRILLIEDDPNYFPMLLKLLGREGFAILSASTGRAGLILAEVRRPDLILLDIKLPDTDGIKLLAALRRNPRTSAIPIILITGLDMPDGVLDAVAAGTRAEPIFRKAEGTASLVRKIRSAVGTADQVLPLDLRQHGQVLRKGQLTVDLKTRRFAVENRTFPPLPSQRFSLLCALMRGEGPVSREKLLLDIWGDNRDPKVVDVTIARLRGDLKRVKHVSIETTRHGYVLTVEEPSPSV